MQRIYSNGNDCDQVKVPFWEHLKNSKRADLAAPFFTSANLLLKAAKGGTKIRLLIELNVITCQKALRRIIETPNSGIEIKYLEKKFHAKVYIFDKDKSALLGSANLTSNGLTGNREAVIKLCESQDSGTIKELQKLFDELWKAGDKFDEERLVQFEGEQDRLRKLRRDLLIEKKRLESEFAQGNSEPDSFETKEISKMTEFDKACKTVFGAIVHRKISVYKRSKNPDILHVYGLKLCFRSITPNENRSAKPSARCYKISFLPQSWAEAMHNANGDWSGCRNSGFFKQPLIVDICFDVNEDKVTFFGQLFLPPGTDRLKIVECIEDAAERYDLQDRIELHARYNTTKPQSTFFKGHTYELYGKHDAHSLVVAMNTLMKKFAPAIEAIGETLAELDL